MQNFVLVLQEMIYSFSFRENEGFPGQQRDGAGLQFRHLCHLGDDAHHLQYRKLMKEKPVFNV